MFTERKMPVLFVGHGSPMNAIETNEFSQSWESLGKELPRPKAILAISAHWMTDSPKISTSASYRQIYDMYGFPDELYRVEYHPDGAPDVAERALQLLGADAAIDNSWGLDHGLWSILCRMYPNTDVPVAAMSVGVRKNPAFQFELGRKLQPLRDEGVMILASGNVVHNLSRINWKMSGGYGWSEAFDLAVKVAILQRDFQKVVNFKDIPGSHKAFYTVEHFYPLLTALGAVREDDTIRVFNESLQLGSLSMTSYAFGL